MTIWATNDQGLWCTCCGYLVAGAREADAVEFVEPEECRQCGFPDVDAMADYHCGPDEDDAYEEPEFDCPKGPDGYCPLAGSEESDWDCPYS